MGESREKLVSLLMDGARTLDRLAFLLRESRAQIELFLADLYAGGIDVIVSARKGVCYYRVNQDAPNGEPYEEETA